MTLVHAPVAKLIIRYTMEYVTDHALLDHFNTQNLNAKVAVVIATYARIPMFAHNANCNTSYLKINAMMLAQMELMKISPIVKYVKIKIAKDVQSTDVLNVELVIIN